MCAVCTRCADAGMLPAVVSVASAVIADAVAQLGVRCTKRPVRFINADDDDADAWPWRAGVG